MRVTSAPPWRTWTSPTPVSYTHLDEDDEDDYDEDEDEDDDYDEPARSRRGHYRRHSHRDDYDDYDEDDYDDYDEEDDYDDYDEDRRSFGHYLLGFFKTVFWILLVLIIVLVGMNLLHYTGAIDISGVRDTVEGWSCLLYTSRCV